MFAKTPRYRNKKILAFARNQRCTFEGPTCTTDFESEHETSVFCHLNESFAGKGMSRKCHDFAGFIGCASCHRWYDSNQGSYSDRVFYAFRAMTRTLERLFDAGVIK